jgi:hypothetical protein
MKKLVLAVVILVAASSMSYVKAQMISVDVVIGNRPPAPNEAQLMRAEEQKHPNIAASMHDIEKAMQRLHDAPDDFGGHKAQAESDLRQAYISLRKALYFRLWH